MDQLRQVGEALGSLKALTVFKDDIQINRRQCGFLLDMFTLAFETILDEIRQNLRPEEKNTTKWKALENPLIELHNVFKEGEVYIKNCLDFKDWWGRTISLHQSNDCVEFHVHNLLYCFAIVVEATERASEISCAKYEGEWNDPKLFRWKYGKRYLVPREVCGRLESVWREDQWCLVELIKKKQMNEKKLSALLLKKDEKFLPSSVLTEANDYQVKRRLGSRCKEIQWLGESFVVKKYYGELNESFEKEVCNVVSLSHPNLLQYHCGLYDSDKKENFLVMELMSKSLDSYIKENCGLRKRVPFSLPAAVDVLLQIARGVEYLHSQKIYHGQLKPSNILLKSTSEVNFRVKIKGFGLDSIKKYTYRKTSNENSHEDAIIWFAPEVIIGDQEQSKHTEKADVYSFGMLCFEVLTGKIPFEEGHLQEDKKGRNICAGERPLFPFTTPRYLVNFTRKCWQPDPIQRPSFPGICRILRYIKKSLVVNPESPPPLVDFYEIESEYSRLFPNHEPVSYVPFQMFAYRVIEKEKIHRAEAEAEGGDVVVPEDHLLETETAVSERKVAASAARKSMLPPKPGKRIGSSSVTADDQRSNGCETPERRDSPPLAAGSEVSEVETAECIATVDHEQHDEIPTITKASLKKEINQKPNLLESSKRKMPLKKKTIVDAKANNNGSPGKINGYSSPETSSSTRASQNSPMLKPCKQCLRLNRECRKPSMMSSSRCRNGYLTDSDTA